MTTITDPHHAAYVTVVDKIAHRTGPWKAQDFPAASACAPTLRGPSLSYGWAAATGVKPCREPACFGPPGDRLWIATRRKGLNHHRLPPGETKTGCQRWAGQNEGGEYDNGLVITPAEATELESKPCKQCWPVGRA